MLYVYYRPYIPISSLYVAVFVLTVPQFILTFSLHVPTLFVLTGAPVYTNIFTLCSNAVCVDRCPVFTSIFILCSSVVCVKRCPVCTYIFTLCISVVCVDRCPSWCSCPSSSSSSWWATAVCWPPYNFPTTAVRQG